MTDTVRAVVAPGCSIPIAPHPAGIPSLPALILHSGDTLDVTPEKMAVLLRARLVLDPATGKVLPPDPQRPDQGPGISVDGGKTWHSDARYMPAAVQEPFAVKAPEPITAGRWDPGFSGMVRQWDRQEADPITGADGKPWPSF